MHSPATSYNRFRLSVRVSVRHSLVSLSKWLKRRSCSLHWWPMTQVSSWLTIRPHIPKGT